ncbi:MAG: DMT family transporter [Leptolyngbya sp. IPPAS B-1204]|uniref:DMT family transporter n=1 Tax=Leptolyngbya sp. NK1-12 TaxID=2547451 RepID=A0AA96WGR9_9CYAN|nr:DMT family transporter [Leptolyngbya sp. NK1-12]MBF2049434.1 DMT family transporter [Elainella sp. C42_A2020_010]RNJ68405.1 MAG: DMT family transporter [Leptolyngbya sp. IPPAS B-1204]WNZ24305.1 DMT family transporter [Leptolyngbya sp. NK1-12]
MNFLFLLTLAVLSGLAITLQGQFMGLLDKGIGTKESIFITYGIGGMIATLMMIITQGGNLRAWHGVPWYAFSAGALGLIIVGTIGYVVPRLGLAPGFTLIVASQFISAVLIDHFGLFGASVRTLDGTKLLGVAILMIGVWLIVK